MVISKGRTLVLLLGAVSLGLVLSMLFVQTPDDFAFAQTESPVLAPYGGQGAAPGMGGMQERRTLMQLIAGMRFIEEDPKLTLSEKQASQMLEIFDELIEDELLFAKSSYKLIRVEGNNSDTEEADPADEQQRIQLRREAVESGRYTERMSYYVEAITKILDKKQLKTVQSLDLSAILGTPVSTNQGGFSGGLGQPGMRESLGGGGFGGGMGGGNSNLLVLFEELYLLLQDKVG